MLLIINPYVFHCFGSLIYKVGMIKHPLLGLPGELNGNVIPCVYVGKDVVHYHPPFTNGETELREADYLPEVVQPVSSRRETWVRVVPVPVSSLPSFEESCFLVTIRAIYFCNIISIRDCSHGI